jgi:hypothetical protein
MSFTLIVFDPEARQQDVYSEIADVCLGVLDGYKICHGGVGQTEAARLDLYLRRQSHRRQPRWQGDQGSNRESRYPAQALRAIISVAEQLRCDRFMILSRQHRSAQRASMRFDGGKHHQSLRSHCYHRKQVCLRRKNQKWRRRRKLG